MKRTFLIIAITVILFGVWLISSRSDSNSSGKMPSTSGADKTTVTFSAQPSELYIGNPEASAVMVEYADFKCPSCGQFHQTSSKQLREAYPDNLKIAFRPMAVIGPDSERAAVGSYCAAEQGKFVEFHDAVFDHMWNNYYGERNFAAEFEDVLTAEVLTDIGDNAGLSKEALRSCLNDGSKKEIVAKNLSLAQQAGVRGTPTFVINDQVVTGPQPFNVFKSLIDLQL